MDKLTLIIFLLFVTASAIALFLWQRIGKVEDKLQHFRTSKEEKQSELESTRKDAKIRREELESMRDDLHATKAKLKKLQKKEQDHRVTDKKQESGKSGANHVGAVVRVTNEELEMRHQDQIDALAQKISKLEEKVQKHKEREAKTKAETEKATQVLKLNADTESNELDPDVLKTQLEALKRAAVERETELKRDLKRAQAQSRSHERRASTNHQLYQVAKGQLSLVEDRMARLKLKYEGAIDPAELVKAKAEISKEQTSDAAVKETKAPAKEAKAPAKETKAPAKETKAPAKEAKAPAKEAKAPAKEAKAPAKEVVSAEEDNTRAKSAESNTASKSEEEVDVDPAAEASVEA